MGKLENGSCWCAGLVLLGTLFFTLDCGKVDERLAADTVLLNGHIITVDPDDTVAEGLAVKNGRIVAVGPSQSVESLIGPGTRVIDLNGATATPGLIDSHSHFSGSDLLYLLDLSHPNVQSIAEIVAKVKAQAETLDDGQWVQGRGWDEGKLSELRYIYASDLDPVSPENPGLARAHHGSLRCRQYRCTGACRHHQKHPRPSRGHHRPAS